MSDFFSYKSRLKEFCTAENVICPACSQSTDMHIFENYDSVFACGVPAGSFDKKYFALCPKCTTSFFLSEETAKSVRLGKKELISGDNLTPADGKGAK